MPGIESASSGASAITASVVRNKAAIDPAFCSADLVTLAASIIPALPDPHIHRKKHSIICPI